MNSSDSCSRIKKKILISKSISLIKVLKILKISFAYDNFNVPFFIKYKE